MKMYLRSAAFHKRFQHTFHGAVIWKIKKVKKYNIQINTVHADAILLWLLLHADKDFLHTTVNENIRACVCSEDSAISS